MTITAPNDFKTITSYCYSVSFHTNCYSDKITNLDIFIVGDEGDYSVSHVEYDNTFSGWGWFQQECKAPTLGEMKQMIIGWIAEHEADIRQRKIAADAATKAWEKYHKAHTAWEQEQLDQAEMIPVEDIYNHQVDAVISMGQIYSDYGTDDVYNNAYYSNSDNAQYHIYDNSKTYAGDRGFDRYVNIKSKMKAIRKFTRPEPQRADFGI